MQELLQSLKIDTGGLVPAIAQDADTGEVLMVAWMNADALRQTLKTGLAHYWSRSRRALWRKGEKSGHVQKVREIRTDCDKDVLLLKVEQIGGAACHTGYRSCFSWRLQEESWVEEGEKIFNPEDKYGKK
ncbi:MAG: phosphoribosyl-AMP cyclohydrolase [Planctomycetota bacterium]|nr:phosphoribosyl-AMP cyclohydrolase [Planctomycetota bacterium]